MAHLSWHYHLAGLKRGGSRAADTPSRVGRVTQRDSNSNPISPVSTGPEEEEAEEEEEEVVVVEETETATSLDHCQSESYHWCEEDDLTSSEAATSTDKTIGSSGDPDPHSAEEYAEMAKKVDLNLAHIDMENFKSADLFQSEQIRSLLIEYNRPILCSQSQLSQDDCSLTDCGSLCKSGPLFSPQRAVPGVCGVGGGKGISPSDCSIDSLNMAERDECWLLEEAGDGASQLLCRTNMTNYTLAWSSSASGTDQDLDYNEPGTSSSGSEQSHWSSSGSGGRVAPPIPPWPNTSRQQQFTGNLRNDPTPRKLQCWAPQPPSNQQQPIQHAKSNMKKSTTEQIQKSHKEDGQQQEIRRAELTNFQSIGNKSEDSPSLSDMDNGNGKTTSKDNRTRQRPVFTKTESKATTPPSSGGLSLLQIYMRQRSQTSMERESNKKSDDVIASGGGEGWVEDYPSSADEKLGLESICSSLADEDDDSEEDDSEEEEDDDDDDDDLCQNNRSLTLTDVSDIEQTSIQIDAVPFNTTAATSSLDKLIAKIKPFELGLSPASIEEHWNFESRMRLTAPIPTEASGVDKGCQVAINPATSATQEESTLTDPIKPQAYLIFPSYSLPDLSFLKKHDYTWIGDVLLSPQNFPASTPRKPDPIIRQHTQQTFDDLKRRQMGHVKDWESLKILLPEEIRQQINNIKPTPVNRNSRPRPKSCEQTVILRNAKKTTPRPVTCRGSVAWPDATAGYMLPTVPQSPPGGAADGGPPPLPKRTASLPHSPAAVRQRRNVALSTESVKSAVSKRAANAPTANNKTAFGYTMRKTVSFGEHLSGGFLKMASQRRPLSLSQWSGGGSLDMNSPGEEDVAVNLEQKQELVKTVSVACSQLCKIMNQSMNVSDEESCTNHSKSVARCLTSQLSPAIYQLLSDGLLPNVNTFFGQVNNSVWRVVEASVKKGPGLPWIEELVFCLNSEESLPEGPVRFGVFITELVNMGGLDWWLDNLSAKETILRRHYAPHGFLYLCHTSTRPLMDELQSYLRPLAALPFDNSLPLPPPKKPVLTSPSTKPTSPANKPSTPTKTILKSPTRSKTQRPMSYVQNSPSKTSPKPLYRRTQSQHSGLSPKKSNNVVAQQQQQPESNNKTETKVEEFSSLKQKWESLCGDRKKPSATATGGNKSNALPVIPAPVTVAAATGETSPLKSRIPRPVFRFSK